MIRTHFCHNLVYKYTKSDELCADIGDTNTTVRVSQSRLHETLNTRILKHFCILPVKIPFIKVSTY